MIDSHLPDMTHYDAEKYWLVFERAEQLDVPIYFHPSPASETVYAEKFKGNYPDVVATGLSTGAWGWHEDLGLHLIRLYAAGVFQRFPKLKIIIGHVGEIIPMMIDRINCLKFLKRGRLGNFSYVWEKNIWLTTSEIFGVRALEMLLKVTSLEHVLYSVDSPFEKSETGWAFIKEIKNRSVLSDEELNHFLYGSAKKLLEIAVVP